MKYLEQWFGMQQANKSGMFAAKFFEPTQVSPEPTRQPSETHSHNEVTNAK